MNRETFEKAYDINTEISNLENNLRELDSTDTFIAFGFRLHKGDELYETFRKEAKAYFTRLLTIKKEQFEKL